MKTITKEQLKDISISLYNRLNKLADQLKEEKPNVKSDYWIDVDMSNTIMYLSADNGYDISESIEVSTNDRDKILNVL